MFDLFKKRNVNLFFVEILKKLRICIGFLTATAQLKKSKSSELEIGLRIKITFKL